MWAWITIYFISVKLQEEEKDAAQVPKIDSNLGLKWSQEFFCG